MQSQLGFTKFTPTQFETWIAGQSVSRTVHMLQQHHTWRPSYSNFTGTNHFAMQDGMRRYHVNNNGWSDIGQHFSIFPDGAVLSGRRLNQSPACILNKNSGAICIENIGDFDVGQDQMTQAQQDAILRVSAAILRRFSGIAANQNGVVYHHWFAAKSCPGTGFFGGNDQSAFNANFLPGLLTAMGRQAAAPVMPAAAPVIAGVRRYVSVTAGALNIRTGPGSANPKITEHGPAENGSILRVFDERNGWLKISNSKSHWVFGRYTIQADARVISTPDTNIRSGPGMNFEVIDVKQTGEQVFIIGQESDWRKIGTFEWVHQSLLA